MRLSVLVGNVYRGEDHIRLLIHNLACQAFRDFETIIVDSYYEENRSLVTDLCLTSGLKDVIHVPSMAATHTGRKFSWELYSNALLLSKEKYFFQFGVHRYLHHEALEVIARYADFGTAVVLGQNKVESIPQSFSQSERLNSMGVDIGSWPRLSQSGFFSFPRECMIYELNGHNEALLLYHWVDVDLSERAKHLNNLTCAYMPSALLRIDHPGGYTRIAPAKPVCTPEENKWCIQPTLLAMKERRRNVPELERILHDGYWWLRCTKCGTIGVENERAYIDRLGKHPGLIKAPIGVGGKVGRNLAKLDSDLIGKSLDEKVQVITESHSNPRYLKR